MNNIKILVATHKKYEMPSNDIYLPIHVGKEGKSDLGYIGDNSGDNISIKNSNYCELTALYWAWKNLDCDIIGLVHYRRYFRGDQSSKNNLFDNILSVENIIELLNEHDIILPKKRNYYIQTIWNHYKAAHYEKDLQITKEIIELKYPEYIGSFNQIMNGKKIHLYNMFVMKKPQFDEYSKWLFDILFSLEEKVDISGYDTYQSRIFGFISERLFNVWILNNSLKFVENKVINVEGENYLNKFIGFSKRYLNGSDS